MTIQEAITAVDDLKPNAYTQADKIDWLRRLDTRIKAEVHDTHLLNTGETAPTIENYDAQHLSTTLLVPEPFDELYVHYLGAQIDYYNREYAAFNAANAMFESVFSAFRNRYNADHMPIGVRKNYY